LGGENVNTLASALVKDLREVFQDEDARYAYAEAALNTTVAAQIKALREAREMNQQKLAEAIGTKQSGISRLENANYSAWNVETLRKVAKAFDVRLRISFEEFGTLPEEVTNFRSKLTPRRFTEDPVFNRKRAVTRKRIRAFRRKRLSSLTRKPSGRETAIARERSAQSSGSGIQEIGEGSTSVRRVGIFSARNSDQLRAEAGNL
jgi:transcriptional regulator with XRE-family HTH domain